MMMDEKYGSRMRLDEKYGSKGWFEEVRWMINIDEKDMMNEKLEAEL
jgi:hypothetical protein